MIITRIFSGLGNQLFQYAIGRQLSIIRKVPLKLDTFFYETQTLRQFKLFNYNIHASIATIDEVEALSKLYTDINIYSKLYRRVSRLVPTHKRSYLKEKEWWVYEQQLFNTSSNVYIDGYWQHYKYFENIDLSILDELTVKEKYCNGTMQILSEIQSNTSSVSIHIRRGDYVSDPEANKLMGLLPTEYYWSAINYIRQNVSKPVFYFFSDDINWTKSNLKIAGKCFYVSTGKDYIDLDLMSKCSHNIIANSSFSWWAAFLNRNPHKVVIAPKRWVIPEDINKKIQLQFPSWLKL